MRDSVQTYLLCQIANGAGGTGAAFFVGDTVFVDQEFGSDATGARELPSKPFATLTAAKNAAIAGDTIVVRPGTYNEHDLLKDQVNWYFMQGAIVDYAVTLTDSRGIFDDTSGPVTSSVGGYGIFKQNDPDTITGNTGVEGLVVITNAATTFRLRALDLYATSWLSDAGIAVNVINCTFVSIDVDRILDPNFGIQSPLAQTSVGNGVIWVKGEFYLKCDQIIETGYCIWANGPNDAAVASNWWIEGNFMRSANAAFYASGKTGTGYRVWVHAKEIISDVTNSNILGGGRYYIIVDKIETSAGSGGAFVVDQDTGSLPQVWLNVQKLTCPGGGILIVAAGTCYANVLLYEDMAAATAAVSVSGGTLHLQGGYAKLLNGKGIVHSGGNSYINDFRVDTSNTNVAANNPVSVSAAGLVLRNCVLIAGTNAASITSVAAQTVKIVTPSAATTAKNANVTLAPNAGFTVDPSVA